MLTAAWAVFIARPVATQPSYTTILRHATAASEPISLRDKARFQLLAMNALAIPDWAG